MVKLKLPGKGKRAAADETEEIIRTDDDENFGKKESFKFDLGANEQFIKEYRENRAKQLEEQRRKGRRPTDIPLWVTFIISFFCIVCNIASLHRDIPYSWNNNDPTLGYGIGLQHFIGPTALASFQFTRVYYPDYNGSSEIVDNPPLPTWNNEWCTMLDGLQAQNTRTLPYDPWCAGIPEAILLMQSIAVVMSVLMCCGNCLLKFDRDRTRYPPVLVWQLLPKPRKPIVVVTFQCLAYSLVHVFCGIFSTGLWSVVNNNWSDCLVLCFRYASGFIFATLAWCLAAVNAVIYFLVHRQRWIIRVNQLTYAVKTDQQQKVVRYTGDIEFAAMLMDKLGSDGRAALHWACALNRSLIVNVLLKAGADIHCRDIHGWTPLHWATRMGHANVVNTLLHSGGPSIINARDQSGNTPLMLCMGTNAMDCASLLIAAGADINEQNLWGQTLLMLCAEEGTEANGLATILLLHKANVVLQDRDDATVLHYAARDGNLYLIKLVKQAIDNLDMKSLCRKRDRFGAKASDEAQIHGHSDVFRLLYHLEDYDKSYNEANTSIIPLSMVR
mmetsp:Transcript_40749/g.53672  ORF Transcript_40749/g.53672 Transcript_40749/m.53672 type:complete len:557 (-) Transcript_40749:122-1792(-)